MKQIRSILQLRQWISRVRKAGKKIGFVPTMGALHEGHLSLVRCARQATGSRGVVVVSVFVNPTQFDRRLDFNRYPKRFSRDAAMCRSSGVDLLFAPTARAIYPADFSTWIEEKSLSLPLCGASRPGHFRGVCTVVMKLFNLVQPDVAVFGQKDAQQAMVVRRMVRDLNFPVRLIVAPTLREPDGLAMSSRNQHLNTVERKQALVLNQALRLARTAFRNGCRRPTKLLAIARSHLRSVPSLRLDYLELVEDSTLRSLPGSAKTRRRKYKGRNELRPYSPGRWVEAKRGDLLVIAAQFGKTRLIDNIRL